MTRKSTEEDFVTTLEANTERQRTENRGQRTEDREQRTEDREQRTENRGQRTENREQRTEDSELGLRREVKSGGRMGAAFFPESGEGI
jgi:hypothetical protein